ncbi:MAG TPA: peptidylprolyl isomerase [Gemmatimonadaceae bacterium]|jgi:cyclophilin family peptidyl-prolyl cis-trans isomerase
MITLATEAAIKTMVRQRTNSIRNGVFLMALTTIAACATGMHPEPDPASARGDAYSARAPNHFLVRMETSQGPITLSVHRDWAPRGADRFYYLVQNGLLNGERFFRVRANFIAQFGLNGDPAVIAAWKTRAIPDDSVRTSNMRGTLAYAMTGPNTRTTQIYINLANNPQLDAQGFAPFAEITSGMDAADRLYSGYGESAGGGVRAAKQGLIEAGGNAYLTRAFPKLDYIVRAVVVRN